MNLAHLQRVVQAYVNVKRSMKIDYSSPNVPPCGVYGDGEMARGNIDIP